VLVAEPLPVYAASSLVQQNGVFCVGAGGAIRCGSTLSVSFSSNVASGNVVVAAVVSADAAWNPPPTVTSVGDSLGSSFTQAVTASHGLKYAYIYYATLTSSGPDTATVTFSSDISDVNGFAYLYIYEVSGVTTTGVATGTGSGTFSDTLAHSIGTSSTGPFQPGAFLVAIMANDILSSSWVAGSGFQLSPPPHSDGTVDQFVLLSKAEYSTSGVSSPTTFPATLSSGSGGNWIEVGIALNAAPQISLSPIFGPPGTIVTVTGSGFTLSAQPFCDFVSNPSGLVGPIRGTDFVCMVAGDGSIGIAWFVVAAGASGSYSVTVSYFGQASAPVQFNADGNLGGPVGGVVTPANTLAVLAPWLAVIGLVGCIGTAVAVARKRRASGD